MNEQTAVKINRNFSVLGPYLAQKNKTQGDLDFVAHLLRDVPFEDIEVVDASDLADIALESLRACAQPRKPGESLISIRNGTVRKKDGETISQAIVDIVNDDMPFLVDSLLALIQEQKLPLALVAHPIYSVRRNEKGEAVAFSPAGNGNKEGAESIIHVHIDTMLGEADIKALHDGLKNVFQDVRVAVEDWRPMRSRIQQAVENYRTQAKNTLHPASMNEATDFLEWLLDNNFTFLGVRVYDFSGDEKTGTLKRNEDEKSYGLLRDPEVPVLKRGGIPVIITPEIRDFLVGPEPLIVTKANLKSNVHRRVYMDYIGIKRFTDDGQLQGEIRVIGHFTSTAYTRSATRIPFLRRKISDVMELVASAPEGHSGKVLLNILESYPRDELFQIDVKTLKGFSQAILQLMERPRVRVLSRVDKFDRFVSVIVFLPRDHYNTRNRVLIGDYLKDAYKGRVSAYYPSFLEGSLSRIHYIIGRDAGDTPELSQRDLEAAIRALISSWDNRLETSFRRAFGNEQALKLAELFKGAFSGSYQEAFTPKTALEDIAIYKELAGKKKSLHVVLYGRRLDEETGTGFKIYHLNEPISLSERVPIIENMGFKVINERTYRVSPAEGFAPMWIHDMTLTSTETMPLAIMERQNDIEQCFYAVWNQQAEQDGYNALVLHAGLNWRQVSLLRTISRYLRQARITYSQGYMWERLNAFPHIAARLVRLFEHRFNPKNPATPEAFEQEREKLLELFEDVSSLDDDVILRRFLNVIDATLRTNYFQRDKKGDLLPTLNIKLDSKKLTHLPEPRPFREIFVYSSRVEGVHLRFGLVARGGLRWSDRAQDFRTEVLGLVKAQQVKNAVIVPVGAKGGFYPKRLNATMAREEFLAEGTESYKLFINSLLEITDNLNGDKVVPPRDVVRLDGDDPYLVVAADKGTATFSDTANGISQAHGFWLDDAFASGGSAGYDHKKMGITARGAWEAVKRHFREKDIDIQSEPFSVVGVGDMSGDVFGNGMLLSKTIRLIAAFDHRDIFIDPEPDPETSWQERKRLFDMGRCTWQDYDKGKISKGGGIFSQSAKSITLTPEIMQALEISEKTLSPVDLKRAIIRAKADLLWFGGIGTYVCAEGESSEQVGDRANDSIRATANELRVKVVGEGANLGMTQKARIAFNMAGGRCNSDAIDNSAGVNSSDIEVNIKIALSHAEREGKLTREARNILLAEMTDTVGLLVLRNNYLQTLAISLAEGRGMEDFGYQAQLMKNLEARKLLDRRVEDLPDDLSLIEREKARKPLTRAEIGVLLAYSKLTLYDELLQSDIPDDPYLEKELLRYFPPKMTEKFRTSVETHRLRREIIATMLANSMINRGGPTYLTRLLDQAGAGVTDIARAFVCVRDMFMLTSLNDAIDALDSKVSGATQLEAYGIVQDLLIDQSVWFLLNIDLKKGLREIIDHHQKALKTLMQLTDTLLPVFMKEKVDADTERFVEAGIPKQLAQQLALLPAARVVPDITKVADSTGKKLEDTASVYFQVMHDFQVGRAITLADSLEVSDYYDGLVLERAKRVIAAAHRQIVDVVLSTPGDYSVWIEERKERYTRTRTTLLEIIDGDMLSVSKFAVAAGLLDDLSKN